MARSVWSRPAAAEYQGVGDGVHAGAPRQASGAAADQGVKRAGHGPPLRTDLDDHAGAAHPAKHKVII